jgi:hypothetical protein
VCRVTISWGNTSLLRGFHREERTVRISPRRSCRDPRAIESAEVQEGYRAGVIDRDRESVILFVDRHIGSSQGKTPTLRSRSHERARSEAPTIAWTMWATAGDVAGDA